MSKLESGEIYLEEKPFNIYQIINEVIDVVGKMADEREIKVEHKTPEIIHKDLIGSPIHLKRLLMNILSNAVKYNKPILFTAMPCEVAESHMITVF